MVSLYILSILIFVGNNIQSQDWDALSRSLFFNTDIKSSNIFFQIDILFQNDIECDHFKWNFYNVFY